MKVLIAVDGSDCTQRAIDYLAKHPWPATGGALSVFTVMLQLPHRAAAFAGANLVHLDYADDAEQVLRLQPCLGSHGGSLQRSRADCGRQRASGARCRRMRAGQAFFV